MSAAHTPGPWVNDNGLVCGRHLGIDGKVMGPSYDIFNAGECPHESFEDEWRANARLIAAAPELLKAHFLIAKSIGSILREWDNPNEKKTIKDLLGDLQKVSAIVIVEAMGERAAIAEIEARAKATL